VREFKRTKEQQKDYIFDIFSKCQSDTSSGRRQVYYPILCDQIYRWYRDYLSANVDRMGLEIANVINRFLKADIILKIPSDKDGFFKYLNTALNREKAGYYRSYNENDIIKIPREKKRKLREAEDFIRMKESLLGRKLSADEKNISITKWFKNQEYIDLFNAMNTGNISLNDNNSNELFNILDSEAAQIYKSNTSDNPLEKILSKSSMEAILKAVNFLLGKKQERSRECYRALFTLYCMENIRNLEDLMPVLDKNVLESSKNSSKSRAQYEIYKKYHPNAQKASAEAMASKNLIAFINDIRMYLKETNS